jgi:hypothetical protein
MFWLIETQEQFEELKYRVGKEVFIELVRKHPEIHPGIFAPISLYIRNIDQNQERGYLVNFSHPEALSCDILQIKELLKGIEKIYVVDKKAFNHFYFGQNVVGIGLGEDIDMKPTAAHQHYSQKYNHHPELNSIIPIVKHFEHCETLFQNCLPIINKYEYNQYNQEISDVFWFIERNGLKVNSAFERYFPLERPFLSKYGNYIFTQYNLDTLTGRPSNAFNTVNFAALNKESGCRSVFIPRNDFLLEIDLTAYHPTLISKLVNYQSPTGDIYEDFAKQYSLSREEAKILVFKQLYGNIFDQYKDFEFFKLTREYVTETWKKFQTEGYIEKIISKQKFFSKDLENMNPQKLFNYLIQSYETEYNVGLLKEILTVLNKQDTKVILYTYDAILLDASKQDKEYIKEILNIFQEHNLKIKVTYGPDYDSIKTL